MKQKTINQPRLVIRTDQTNRDGTNSILLRINLGGIKKDISLKVSCLLKDFDERKGIVKGSSPYRDSINLILESQLRKATEIIFKARISDSILSMDDFVNQYFGLQNNGSFIEFIEKEIELEKKRSDKAEKTILKYGFQLNKLVRYKKNMRFDDLTESFIANFEEYMRVELKNGKGGSSNTLKFIRKFNLIAIQKKLTDKYPFENYKIKEEKSVKIKHLQIDEFNSIKAYFEKLHSKHKHYLTLKSFLFSCYTGLRYGDGKKLTLNDCKGDMIYIRTEKTKAPVAIPLLSEAKKLLNFNLDPRLPNLGTPCDQKCNRALKEVAEACGIHKPISTHYARYTFACLALNNGVNAKTVQNILAHTTSKQTDHYMKLFDETKKSEMLKLEGKF